MNNARILLAGAVIAVAGLATMAAASGEMPAQDSTEALIERALEAGPSHVTEEATVLAADGTVLREGSNGWSCVVEVVPGYGYPACSDDVWLDFVESLKNGREPQVDRVGISYMLAGDAYVSNDDPSATDPATGGTWIQEGPHIMIAVPDPEMLSALPRDPFAGGPYVMWGGTPYAHVMVPTGPRPPQPAR